MGKYGVNEGVVLKGWENPKVRHDLKLGWQGSHAHLFNRFQRDIILSKDMTAPLYKNMRIYLDAKVTEVVKNNFRFKPKIAVDTKHFSVKEHDLTGPKSILTTAKASDEKIGKKNSWVKSMSSPHTSQIVENARRRSLDKRNDSAKQANEKETDTNRKDQSLSNSSGSSSSSESSSENYTSSDSESPTSSNTSLSHNNLLKLQNANNPNYPSDMILEQSQNSGDESSVPTQQLAISKVSMKSPDAVSKIENNKLPDAFKEILSQSKSSLLTSGKLIEQLKHQNPNISSQSVSKLQKQSDDSFDVSDLSEVENKSQQKSKYSALVRKSTGEIAASALKPLSRVNSTQKSNQSVNFKVESEDFTSIDSIKPLLVACKPANTTETEISDFLDDLSVSESKSSLSKNKTQKTGVFEIPSTQTRLINISSTSAVIAATKTDFELNDFELDEFDLES
ncbi:hypothetical protein HK100_012707 [Physocladia obscura]|uniref:Uncharacterized protein n=1 Tax=Physocladia obscura TaxID=109957 RepID=A0AAD5XFP7_9FUNG|nr:hypothetical protein HK100_012707 [Physocladia obscura]